MQTFGKHACPLCGQIISYNGLSQNSHMRMHIREGYYVQTSSHPNRYERTEKPFNKELYQLLHPERAYTMDDYFPITGHPKDKEIRDARYKEMAKRKKAALTDEQKAMIAEHHAQKYSAP